MHFKRGKISKVRILLLLVILLTVGLASSSCIQGLQPIGWSGGTVSDGVLFVGSKEGRLVTIGLVDETRHWSAPLKAEEQAGGFGCLPTGGAGCSNAPTGVAIYGTPVVAEDLVYIGGYNGKVYAFVSSSMGERWIYPRDDNLEPIVGGVAVAQDKIYFGSSDGMIYALDAATGDKQWEFETGDKVWATPAFKDDTLFIGSFDHKLYALWAASGETKWEFEAEGAIASTPLIYDNTVYFGSFDRHLYAVDAATGNLKWKFMGDNWFWAKPVIYDDIIYAACLDGKVYALKSDSGDKIAEFDLGSPVSSSPVVVDDSIIFASQKGVIYALDTGSKQLKRLNDIEENVYGPLSASEGIVYIHTQDLTLHRINVDTGAILMSISLESME
ncbi:PQQ-binding-like beta-propeller repeat protein [Chloroflexota bacterium]